MKEQQQKSHSSLAHMVYIIVTGTCFAILAVVFLLFPRSRHSEIENRDLAEFPDIGSYSFSTADRLTGDLSQWFKESAPFHDRFVSFNMQMKDYLRYNPYPEEEQISIKAPASIEAMGEFLGDTGYSENEFEEEDESSEEGTQEGNVGDGAVPKLEVDKGEYAKLAKGGTIVTGSGPTVRALMVYGGSAKAGNGFINTVNEYAAAFPEQRVYALVAPLATEFYLPERASSLSNRQKPVLDNIKSNLMPAVKYVDAYSALEAHSDENIYLRTDHHWAPLGAYYAARAFAETAGVPFRGLDSYTPHTIHNFVGTMYSFSGDIAVKNAPEDFTYYTPDGVDYESTFITFNTKNGSVTSASKPYKAQFFRNFKDGSSNAYLTFMGSDQNLVKVKTDTPSRRRLLIIKDSYGNALPGYLFFSFGEIHVIDFRYFTDNMKEYVAQNGITDILFAFNIFNASSYKSANRMSKFLSQGKKTETPAAAPADTSPTPGKTTATNEEPSVAADTVAQ